MNYWAHYTTSNIVGFLWVFCQKPKNNLVAYYGFSLGSLKLKKGILIEKLLFEKYVFLYLGFYWVY